jgi:putative phosphoribosyl transferase
MPSKKHVSGDPGKAETKQHRESSQPGGGQGRKDAVDRSGVYPLLQPDAPGTAEVRVAGTWGQGDRGAAGYEDHGGSQFSYRGGQLLGALETHRGNLVFEPQTGSAELSPEEWIPFFNSFSRQHEGWLADITIRKEGEEKTEVRDCRLQGISSDHLSARDEIYLSFGRGQGDHITHAIKNPIKTIFQRDARGAHAGIEITSSDGTITNLRFRAAALPETLNGVLDDEAGGCAKATPAKEEPGASTPPPPRKIGVHIPSEHTVLEGDLSIAADSRGVVLFAHGSGSSRHSPRNRYVAEELQKAGFGTLLMDLLTAEEEALDERTAAMRFDIELLAKRLVAATWWLVDQSDTAGLPIGYFGASTGAAAALVAAADASDLISAVVSRGGRPDLAGSALNRVIMPTLLIVGERDEKVIELNQNAYELIPATKKLEIVPGATHLFEEPGALDSVARLAAHWFATYLARADESWRAA